MISESFIDVDKHVLYARYTHFWYHNLVVGVPLSKRSVALLDKLCLLTALERRRVMILALLVLDEVLHGEQVKRQVFDLERCFNDEFRDL